jgi:translation initiation factor IF-1
MDTDRQNTDTGSGSIQRGVVTEALPNALFRIDREDGENVIGFLSGKMRLHRIKVLIGDKVELQENPYGGKQRIVKRL